MAQEGAWQGDPLRHNGPKLFIVDARNGVEGRYLLDWLHGSWGNLSDADWTVLALSDESRPLRLEELAGRLAADDSMLVIPVRVAWRIPKFDKDRMLRLRDILFGDPRLPGSLRARLILLRDRRRAQCLMGQPATIGSLRARFAEEVGSPDPEDTTAFAGFVARQAALTLEAEERGVRGTRYKVPRFVADSIAASPRFRNALAGAAAQLGKHPRELMPEARRYMKELVSRPSALFLDLRARLERFMMTQGYDKGFRYDPAELERLRELIRTKPTVLLFTHKTYLDGITPNALFFDNDMTMLHSFGGINLDFFGVGTLFRRSGLIFIRRSFADNPVYKVVLRQYIAYLLDKRFPMSWALEGTRSRLGKLMPPKYGILKYVLDAAHDGGIEDVQIVPFVTSFDLIRDVEEYAAEQAGLAKKPESFAWFIGYLKSLREPMGRVRIDLGAPVVVARAPDPDDKLALAKIAFDASVSANRVTPLTVTSVMCLILLGAAPRGATAEELAQITTYLSDWAKARGIRLSDELASLDRAEIRATADKLVNSGLIHRDEAGSATVYTIESARHPMASYYRNSIIHHFLDKTIIELALFRTAEEPGDDPSATFWAEAMRLRDLFKFEFFYPPREAFRLGLEAELDRTDGQWSAHLNGGTKGLETLVRRFQPLVGHAALLPFVEAYTVVFDQLVRLGPGEVLDQQRCVAKGLTEGRQAYLLRRITSEASIGKILFENGYRLAAHLGLAGATTDEIAAGRRALLAELRALSRRMERMRLQTVTQAERSDVPSPSGLQIATGEKPVLDHAPSAEKP
ncbi:MAG TPA: glycerol-3-phosphate 1-O-acyltransferase [Novosphingobium sp.]|nr:glycerol-3-phosphate 1-O-acyltransferase [Novosphingobium sp.]